MKKPGKSGSKNAKPLNPAVVRAGAMAEKYGLTRISGELAMLLFLNPEPISIGEMSVILQVSKPSVSTNIRFLELWRVVRKVPVRNDRRDFYEFSDDLWEAARAAFEMVFQRDVRSLIDLLDTLSQDAADDQLISRRLAQAGEIFHAVDSLGKTLFDRPASPAAPIREIPVE